MRFHQLCLLLVLLGYTRMPGASTPVDEWNRVEVAPMKTSIYIGSVTLAMVPFARDGNLLSSTYTARVFPWIFWNETGRIEIKVSDANLAKLQSGERCQFTGDAVNQKNKPRRVTGYVEPAGSDHGKIKVRIIVDDVELVFNGDYVLGRLLP